MVAARYGKVECVKRLLNEGRDISSFVNHTSSEEVVFVIVFGSVLFITFISLFWLHVLL